MIGFYILFMLPVQILSIGLLLNRYELAGLAGMLMGLVSLILASITYWRSRHDR